MYYVLWAICSQIVSSLSVGEQVTTLGLTPCGEPPGVEHATWTLGTRFGERITYLCSKGHWVDGDAKLGASFEAVCGGPSQGFTGVRSCEPAKCASLPSSAKNGNFRESELPKTFSQRLVYDCKRGFTGDGLANGPELVEFFCDEGGVFQPTLPDITTCLPVSCGYPPVIARTQAEKPNDARALRQTVRYVCDDQAATPFGKTEFTATCGEDGKYAGLSECTLRSCAGSTLPKIPFARPGSQIDQVTINGVVSYVCEPGFELDNHETSFFVRCELAVNGAMQFTSPLVSQCKPRLCEALPEFPGARMVTDNPAPRFKDVVTLECESGLALDGDKTKGRRLQGSCDATGTWGFVAKKSTACKPIQCGLASSLPADFGLYGVVNVVPGEFSARDNRTIEVTCAAGARTSRGSATATIRCGDDGEFVSDGLCGIPCAAADFNASDTLITVSSVVAGELAYATCSRGHAVASTKLQTKQELKCSRDGVAQPLLPCELLSCGLAPSERDESARLIVAGSIAKFEETVDYRCKAGYVRKSGLIGESIKFTCGEDGQYHGDNDCVKVECLAPPALPHAKITTNVYQVFEYQEFVQYSCLPGYQSIASFYAVCGSDGSWEYHEECGRVAPEFDFKALGSEGDLSTQSSAASASLLTAIFAIASFFLIN